MPKNIFLSPLCVFAKCQTSFKSDHRFVYVGLRRDLREKENTIHQLSTYFYFYDQIFIRNANECYILFSSMMSYFQVFYHVDIYYAERSFFIRSTKRGILNIHNVYNNISKDVSKTSISRFILDFLVNVYKTPF